MLSRSSRFKAYDAYVTDVFNIETARRASQTSSTNFDISDDAVITLPSETSSGSCFLEDVWEWPEYLFPHFSRNARCLNFSLPHDLRSHGGEDLLRTLKIIVILCLAYPLKQRKRLPSLREMTRVLNEFCYDMLTKAKVKSFSELDLGTYAKLIDQFDRGRHSYGPKLLSNLAILREYGRVGLLLDYPGADPTAQRSATVYNGANHDDQPLTSIRHINGPLSRESERADGEDARQYRPLPDEYLAEVGWRCSFYLDHIGPNLVRIFADHPDQPHHKIKWFPKGRRKDGPTQQTIASYRSKAWEAFLRQFQWVDKDGAPLIAMPFHCNNMPFPPSTKESLFKLVGRHMDALIHMLMLLSGGRTSEVQSFRRDVIVRPSSQNETEDSFALLEGRTMKPSATNVGDDRNWPIPEIVAGWIANQTALAKELGPLDSQSIWMSMSTSNANTARVDMYHRCTSFASRHNLSHLVDGTAHPHRYRKSIARLALLALSGAPMLIMQMFGHRDLMTTLRYLLSDPAIRDDLRELLGERRIEIALNLVEDLDSASGRAADTLRSARDAYFDELKVPLNVRSQKITLFQFVTARLVDGSVDIKIVYPGVVCIRSIEQDGACAIKGMPIDPARCQSRCAFRMDLALRKSEVVAIIEDCLNLYLDARDKQNLLVQSAMAANIFDNVSIFSDILAHYEGDARYKLVVRDHDAR